MLRVFIMALLMLPTVPTYADEAGDAVTTAQQQRQPQQTPRRNCEKQQEGIS